MTRIALPWAGATLEDFVAGLQPQVRLCSLHLQIFSSYLGLVKLTTREYNELNGCAREDRLRRAFALWTVKEAYTKALGIGLGYDFSLIDMEVDATSRTVVSVSVAGEELNGWTFVLLEWKEDYLVAVASRGDCDSSAIQTVSLEQIVAQYEITN